MYVFIIIFLRRGILIKTFIYIYVFMYINIPIRQIYVLKKVSLPYLYTNTLMVCTPFDTALFYQHFEA